MPNVVKNQNSSRSPRALKMRWLASTGFLIRTVLFAGLWGVLTGWQINSLGVGLVFIFAASLFSLYLAPEKRKTMPWLKNPLGLISFGFYFAVQSLRGGWDIAKLALKPGAELSPGFIRYRTSLESDTQIFTFMQVLSLLPGTVSAKQEGDELIIHVLNLSTFDDAEIDDCQNRIRHLLGKSVLSDTDTIN